MSSCWRGIHRSTLTLSALAAFVGSVHSAHSAAAEEPSPGCERPPLKPSRQDEDHAFLSNPECRTGFWDPLKYIRLTRDPAKYLSLGADLRERFESFGNRDWGRGPSDAALLHRLMVHGDLHWGAPLRLFVQLTSNFAMGRAGGPGPVDEDQLDLHQAFVDVRLEPPRPGPLTIRVGRQEIDYEGARLISVREGANVRLSFDAVRLMQHVGQARVDVFAAAPVETDFGVFDDGWIPGQALYGAYASAPTSTGSLAVDLFYFGFDRRDAVFDQGTAHESRHSFGVRLFGETTTWDYDVELVYQLGTFGAGRIDAWTVASDAGFALREIVLAPRLGIQLNATSGDRDLADAELQTFNPLFPKASYFTDANLIGPLNHIDVHPTLTVHPTDTLSIELHYDAFFRESRADGVYRPSGALIASGQTSRARSIGSELALRSRWQADRHATVVASYSHFFAGPFLRNAGLGGDVDFFALWITYRI